MNDHKKALSKEGAVEKSNKEKFSELMDMIADKTTDSKEMATNIAEFILRNSPTDDQKREVVSLLLKHRPMVLATLISLDD